MTTCYNGIEYIILAYLAGGAFGLVFGLGLHEITRHRKKVKR
jgi:hypothetical protein